MADDSPSKQLWFAITQFKRVIVIRNDSIGTRN